MNERPWPKVWGAQKKRQSFHHMLWCLEYCVAQELRHSTIAARSDAFLVYEYNTDRASKYFRAAQFVRHNIDRRLAELANLAM